MKNTLVTGAPGFVGANLTRRLLTAGHRVHVLVHQAHDVWRLREVWDDLTVHQASLQDADEVSKVVAAARPEWVFHLAAHGAYPTQTDYREMVRTNLLGTMNLVEACVGYGFEALVNSGSSSEYGFQQRPPQETDRPDPNSHYAVTKAAATMYSRYAAVKHDVHLVTLRLYSVYGPYEEPTRLWPTLIIHALARRLPVLAEPEIARDFVFVEDVADAFLRAAATSKLPRGSVFNVGSGRQTTLSQLVELVRKELGVDQEPRWGTMPRRAWDTSVWVADSRKAQEELGWTPTCTVEDGVRLFVSWFREHADLRERYEQRLGLAV